MSSDGEPLRLMTFALVGMSICGEPNTMTRIRLARWECTLATNILGVVFWQLT